MIASPEGRHLRLPRLHVVTDEQIIRGAGFTRSGVALLHAHRGDIALHLRGRGLSGRELFDAAATIAPEAAATGALLVINDRVDVALCCAAPAIQLPGHSLSVMSARSIVGRGTLIGTSVHSPEDAGRAVEEGADFLLAGTVFKTPSHPEAEGTGTGWLGGLAALGRPVIAIGGIEAGRARDVVRAGAHGVAVMRAIWSARDPVEAAARLLDSIE